MKSQLSSQATMALDRTERAYAATQEQTSQRALNRAETRFYAAAEALYHVLQAEREPAQSAGALRDDADGAARAEQKQQQQRAV